MKTRILALSLLLPASIAASAFSQERNNPDWNVTTAAGFPHFFSLQVARKVTDKLALGVAAGISPVPESTKSCGAQVSMFGDNFEVTSRYHFSRTSFFGGFNLGYQVFRVHTIQNTIPGGNYDIIDGVKVIYATPHIGWLKVYVSGFSIGSELGLRIPLTSSRYTEKTGPGGYSPDVGDSVNHGLDALAKKPLPFVTLLRLGYSF